MRDGLSIIRCVWVRNDLSGETYIGSPANSCYLSCQVINHALASERTKASCLNACGRQYSPHCVGWNEEGGRGGAAERCEVRSHESGGGRPIHSLHVTRQKRNSKAHEKERKRLGWVGVIICMCLLWMKSLSELVTGCLNFSSVAFEVTLILRNQQRSHVEWVGYRNGWIEQPVSEDWTWCEILYHSCRIRTRKRLCEDLVWRVFWCYSGKSFLGIGKL